MAILTKIAHFGLLSFYLETPHLVTTQRVHRNCNLWVQLHTVLVSTYDLLTEYKHDLWILINVAEFLRRWVTQLVKKFPSFMKPEFSLSSSEEPATAPYSGPDKHSPHPHNFYLPRSISPVYTQISSYKFSDSFLGCYMSCSSQPLLTWGN